MLISWPNFLKIAPERSCDHKFERGIEEGPFAPGRF
jgi:hypothetical protein